MFEGFTRTEIKTSGARIVTVHGGKGPPLLLLHGNPFSHLSWHKFAPQLAEEFTVIATDLRGYGDSEKPPGGDDHSGYSFRAMAQDQIEVMAALGSQALLCRRTRSRRPRAAPHVPRSPASGGARRHPRHHPAASSVQPSQQVLGDLLVALVLHDPALRFSRASDERRPGLFHREETCQDQAGFELLRFARARRI